MNTHSRWHASTSVKNNALILVGYSVRAIAQIAHRMGVGKIFAFDLFADVDTEKVAFECASISIRTSLDIDQQLALDRMNDLATDFPTATALFTSGLERHFPLIEHGPAGWNWLNCPVSTIAAVRDFRSLSEELDALKIPYPQCLWTVPQQRQSNWLAKSNRSSGGSGIFEFSAVEAWSKADYWQRDEKGQSISVSICVSQNGCWQFIGYSRQLAPLNECRSNRFRFEGLLSGISVDIKVHDKIITYIDKLINRFKFTGWLGIDFLVFCEQVLLLEINPRPTAAMELFDFLRLNDSPLEHHINACLQQSEPENIWRLRDHVLAGLRVVYASQAISVGENITWPAWVRDIPHAGQSVPTGAPICTVMAECINEDELEQTLAFRAKKLEHLLKSSS